MTKKYILFSLILGAIASQAEARNFLGSWEEYQVLYPKATDPTVSDADFITAFKEFEVNNTQYTTNAQVKFDAANEPLVNFQQNYNTLVSHYNDGGAPNDAAKQALLSTQAFFQSRLDGEEKKWTFFQGTAALLADTPDDRTAITTKLTALQTLYDNSGLTPSTKYVFDPVAKTADYTVAYKTQKYQSYLTASLTIAPQDQLTIFSPLQITTLTNVGVDPDVVTGQLNGTDASVSNVVTTRTDKWRTLAGGYLSPDYIPPLAPLTPVLAVAVTPPAAPESTPVANPTETPAPTETPTPTETPVPAETQPSS